MLLLQYERNYINTLHNQEIELHSLYSKLTSGIEIDLDSREITAATLLRMKAYYDLQGNIKELLNKRYSAPASEFFVETILFYLKVLLESSNSGQYIWSERQIKPKKRSIRPDISLWNGDEVTAIIECKTQLGWNRGGWERAFTQRESILHTDYPNANAFLVVMTSDNWPGFDTNDLRVGKQFFALSSIWPKNISEDNIESIIINPIEDLFKTLLLPKAKN